MRLLVHRNDPPGQPDSPYLEPVVSELCKPPHGQLSASDREALNAWAAKYGFVLRNPIDEWLAEAAWRRDTQQ